MGSAVISKLLWKVYARVGAGNIDGVSGSGTGLSRNAQRGQSSLPGVRAA